MSKPVVLYRAVTTTPQEIYYDDECIVEPPGIIIGRQTGYLSRSAAVDAARRAYFEAHEFEIVRSEPVVFLDKAEKLRLAIELLEQELAAAEAVDQ
ncbi:hypothetical protein [Leucobacter sp. NPDC077196]|uniref:hypothetical protein n=1 Tax=Leucobacter sp. NPDC077196 TaxID=3154959 RepID=UPI003426D1F8